MDIEKRNAEIRAAFHAAGIKGQGIVFDVLDSGAVKVSTMKPVNMTPDVVGDKADHGTKVAWLLHEACPEAEIRSYYCLTGKHILTALQSVLDHVRAEPDKQHIVNVSMVGSETDGMEELIDELTSLNVPVVCAAGNDGEEKLNRFPSCYQSPYTASAIQKDGSKCDFSTWHNEVDFCELGKSVQTKRADQATIRQSGTSFSSPILAGKIALLHCEAMQKGKRLTDAELYERLKAGAVDLGTDGRDPYFGWGYVEIMPQAAAAPAPAPEKEATVPAGKITAAQLVAAFEGFMAEGWGYVYGGQGEVYSEALAKKYTAAGRNVPSGRDKSTYFTKDCARWYGHRVADCSGGIVEAFRLHVPGYSDSTANGFFNRCTKTGPISTLPEIPGLCLWKNKHIGIYIGGGWAIEFRGTDYGCVKTKVSSRPWTNWGYLADVVYDGQTVPEPAGPTLLKITTPYMRGDAIKALQTALNGLGYPAGDTDGIYGPKSQAAVNAFVAAHGGGELPESVSVTVAINGREYTGELEG